MTNNFIFKNFGGLFGKTLVIAFFLSVMAVTSFAQSNNLYYRNGGAYFGRVTVYSTHFYIETNGTEIKTYADSCRNIPNDGVICTFGQFKNGQLIYSGEAQFFKNGTVYLNWLYEFIGTQQRRLGGGWVGFRP